MHVCIGVFSNKIQMFLYGLHSFAEHFASTIQYYVNAEQNMYQFSLMFRISDQRPLIWTSAKKCPILQQHFPCVFFLSEVRYQDIVATARKGQSL